MDSKAPPKNTKVTILLSGGVDSTACVAFYLRQRFTVDALHVSYGQPAADREHNASSAIADYFQIPISYRSLRGAGTKTSGTIWGRNAFLLFAALMESKSNFIATGIHAAVPYFDCGPSFVTKTQDLFDCYTDGLVKIAAPFLTWTKPQIWEFCKQSKVPLQLTYSCEGGNEPCGKCASCKDLEALRG